MNAPQLYRFFLISIFLTFVLPVKAQDYTWALGFGSNQDDEGKDLATDNLGNVYIIGSFQSQIAFNPNQAQPLNISAGAEDIFLAKYDSTAQLLWVRQIGGRGRDFGRSLDVDNEGSVYITGSFEERVDFDPGAGIENLESGPGRDLFLAKYDTDGHYDWAIALGGEEGIAEGYQVRLDGRGQLFLSGYASGNTDLDPGAGISQIVPSGPFLAQFDRSGNFRWAFGLGEGSGFLSINGIAADDFGNLIFTGYFAGSVDFNPGGGQSILNSSGSTDAFVAKYNNSGFLQWARQLAGNGGLSIAQDLVVDAGGNIVVTGFYSERVDFDPGAGTFFMDSQASSDIFLLSLDANGNFSRALSFGNREGDAGTNLSKDIFGNIYLSGYFGGQVDFDPGAGERLLNGNREGDIFLLQLDANWDLVWAFQLGGGAFDRSEALEADLYGNLFMTGFYQNLLDFDPSPATVNRVSEGGKDIFLGRYKTQLPAFRVEAFRLYNAENDQLIQVLESGASIQIDDLGSTSLSIQAVCDPDTVGSVMLRLTGELTVERLENQAPYSLFGDSGLDFDGQTFCPGFYTMEAIPYELSRGSGDVGGALSISFRLQGGFPVDSLILIDASVDTDIQLLEDTIALDLGGAGTQFSVRAVSSCAQSVRFVLRDTLGNTLINRSESTLPYALLGDDPIGDYNPWEPIEGFYILEVTPYTEAQARGARGTTKTVYLSISNPPGTGARPSQLEQVFPNPSEDRVISLQINHPPSEVIQMKVFDLRGDLIFQKGLQSEKNLLEVDLSGKGIEAGVYFIRLEGPTFPGETRRLIFK